MEKSGKERYIFQTTIIECQNLDIKNTKGQNEIFVKTSIGNENPQTTIAIKGTTSGEWNQSFSFSNIYLTPEEFSTYQITYEVFSLSPFLANKLIGTFSISIGTLYKKINHEIFNTWVSLHDSENYNNDCTGYLKISCYILGENDKAPIHTEQEKYTNLNVIEETENGEENEKLKILKGPQINKKGYKLSVNIVRAEDFPSLRLYGCNSFVSVRVGEIVLKTQVVENNQNPKFSSRLEFPIYFPLFSDSIIVKAWDKGVPTDLLIANIPEKILEKDIFNITQIQSQNGHIPYTWVNLYGIPKNEKTGFFGKLFKNENTYFEGTFYMGRILLSFSLNPHENPTKGVHFLKGYNEPEITEYKLFVDIYRSSLEIDYDSVIFGIKFGGCKEVFSDPISKEEGTQNLKIDHLDNKKKIFNLSESESLMEEIVGMFPKDIRQLPDLIISVYVKTMFNNKRIGYLRIPPTLSLNNLPTLKRLKIRSLENPANFLGDILLNVKLFDKIEALKIIRVPFKRNKKIKYVFAGFIHSAVELAPFLEKNEYVFLMRISFEEFTKEIKIHTKSKNFLIDKVIFFEIEIFNSIEFISDLKVEVFEISHLEEKNNFEKILNLNLSNQIEIGNFYLAENELIKLKTMNDFKLRPDFHSLSKDNKITGKILSAFYLIQSNKDFKKIKKSFLLNFQIQKTSFKANISCIGLRNLPNKINNPVVVFKILDQVVELHNKVKKKNEFSDNGINVNICDTLEICIELPNFFVFWPFVEIGVFDGENKKRILASCTPLFFFCDFVNEKFKKYFDHVIGLVPMKEANRNEILEFLAKESFLPVFSKKSNDISKFEKEINELKNDFKSEIEEKTINKKRNNFLGPSSEIKESLVSLKKSQSFGSVDDDDDLNSLSEKSDNSEEHDIYKGYNKVELKNFFFDSKKSKSMKKQKVNIQISNNDLNLRDPLNLFHFSKKNENSVFDSYRISSTFEFKNKELEERKKMIENIKNEINKKKSAVSIYTNKELQKMTKDIDLIKKGFVTKTQFVGNIFDKNKKDAKFGRKIEKVDNEIEKHLPYKKIKLYNMTGIFGEIIHGQNGFTFSGKLSEAVLKAEINLNFGNNLQKEEGYFNLSNPLILEIFNEIAYLKVRVYILRGLNLTAQSDTNSIKNRLAGYQAMSSANPYLELKIGDGFSGKSNCIQYINDNRNYEEGTLNPDFYKFYEMDSILPSDHKISISVFDKNPVWKDSKIGSFELDLEDRFFFNKKRCEYLAMEKLRRVTKKRLQKTDNRENSIKLKEELSHLENNLSKIQIDFVKENPIEYKSLALDKYSINRGSLEFFIDVLTEKEEKFSPVINIEKPKNKLFELRMIIWEVKEVKSTKKEYFDLFVRAKIDSEGWSGESVQKETDVHMMSKGNAIYNWRMKFPLKLPCAFPRLKLGVYDFETFSTDQALVETTIEFDNIIEDLIKENYFAKEQEFYQLYDLFNKKQENGFISISFEIISETEILNNQVGDGQDEPNRNPYLEKPREGRKIKDFVKSKTFNFMHYFSFLNFFKYWKIFLALFLIFIVFIILFVYPGILIK